ncbi:hypothetical protein Tco_0218669 [Tanacetum coccineum]
MRRCIHSGKRAITTDASLDAALNMITSLRPQSHGNDLLSGLILREKVQPIEPPLSEGHTSGSGEGRMEHQFELTANVPITPHDSPLLGGYTPGSDEAYEAIHKEGGDSVERAITIAASLDAAQDSDNIIRTQTTAMPNVDIPQGMDTRGSLRRQDTMGDAPAQTRANVMQLLKWKLHENYGVHTLFMDGTPTEINMLVEKKYLLFKKLLEKMLNLQLEAEEESTMAFKLIKFIKSMLEE